MRKVVIVQRRLTHYRLPLFESMRESLYGEDVELVLYYGMPSEAERLKGDAADLSWASRVNNFYFSLAGRSVCWQSVTRSHFQADLVILPQEVSFLSTFLIFFVRMLLGKKTAFWGHGVNLNRSSRSSIGEAVKRVISRRASWWFAYTSMTLRILTGIGYPAARVTVLNNSIDTARLKEQLASVPEEMQAEVRSELALSRGHTAIFLGSLYADKRIDILLESAEILHRGDPLFRLLVLGDGPQRELVQEFCAHNPWCHWLGVRTGSEKALFLKVSDLMLCPGLVGLVVLDAFVSGLPLVTMESESQPPEAAYLEAGVNCKISPADPREYVRTVRDLMADASLHSALSQACLEAAETYTVKNMADRFCQGISLALR